MERGRGASSSPAGIDGTGGGGASQPKRTGDYPHPLPPLWSKVGSGATINGVMSHRPLTRLTAWTEGGYMFGGGQGFKMRGEGVGVTPLNLSLKDPGGLWQMTQKFFGLGGLETEGDKT